MQSEKCHSKDILILYFSRDEMLSIAAFLRTSHLQRDAVDTLVTIALQYLREDGAEWERHRVNLLTYRESVWT